MYKNMCKKLFVFSLAFCLGILFLQIFKPKNKTFPHTQIQDSTILDNAQHISINQKIFIANFFHNFQNAVANDDKKTIVALIHFPIDVQLIDKMRQPYVKEIKSAAEFLQDYDKIFDVSFKKFISQKKTNQLLYSTNGEVFTSGSEIRMKYSYTNESKDYEIQSVKIIKLNKYLSYK